MLHHLKFQITTTAAGIACMIVAVVSAGFAIHDAFRLWLSPLGSSAATAGLFLALAVGLLFLIREEKEEEPPVAKGGAGHWATIAGQLVGAFAAGALGSPIRRRTRH